MQEMVTPGHWNWVILTKLCQSSGKNITRVINKQLKVKYQSQRACLVIKRLSFPRTKGQRKLRARPSTELVSIPSSKIRLNSQSKEMCHAKIRVFAGEEQDTDTWNGDTWGDRSLISRSPWTFQTYRNGPANFIKIRNSLSSKQNTEAPFLKSNMSSRYIFFPPYGHQENNLGKNLQQSRQGSTSLAKEEKEFKPQRNTWIWTPCTKMRWKDMLETGFWACWTKGRGENKFG